MLVEAALLAAIAAPTLSATTGARSAPTRVACCSALARSKPNPPRTPPSSSIQLLRTHSDGARLPRRQGRRRAQGRVLRVRLVRLRHGRPGGSACAACRGASAERPGGRQRLPVPLLSLRSKHPHAHTHTCTTSPCMHHAPPCTTCTRMHDMHHACSAPSTWRARTF